MRTLYPLIEPYQTGFLEIDEGNQQIYWEESGNPQGKLILSLHGGPGSGSNSKSRSFFDPDYYRIIIFDQRGAGKSQPHAGLKNNTTWDLVADIEKLRKFLKIEKWIVFGGSWGSTLGLAYAISFPDRVTALILRGIFLCRPADLRWLYQFGAHHIFPDEWERFIDPIPLEEREDLLTAYYRRLASEDSFIRKSAARSWCGWESSTLRLCFDPVLFDALTESEHAAALARLECHYFINKGFFPTENWLIEQIPSIRHVPAILIHGRYDIVCPMENAWALHRAWPEAKLEIVPAAGHSSSEVGITDALIRATDSFRLA